MSQYTPMTTDLPLFACRKPVVEKSVTLELGNLYERLAEQPDWRTAEDLGYITQSERRQLRALADASNGRIISGQRGYRLTRLATMEECNHAAAWMKHQAGQMIARAIAIERLAHRPEPQFTGTTPAPAGAHAHGHTA